MGGKSKTVTTIPPKTANELELEQLNLQVAHQQQQAIQREQAFGNPVETLAALNAPRPVNPAYTQQQAALAAYRAPAPVSMPRALVFDRDDWTTGRNVGRIMQSEGTWSTPPAVMASPFLPSIHDLDSPSFRAELQRRIDEQTQQRSLQDLLQAQTLAGLTGKPAVTFLAKDSPFAAALAPAPAAEGTTVAGQAGPSVLAVPPLDQALIEEMFSGARTTGEQDIRRFAEGLGGSRGLRLTDSPIGDEALRQQARLAAQLRSAQASTTLDLGVGTRNFLEQQRQYQTSFQEGLRQFQQSLLQQATQNRMALAGMQPSSIGLGLNYGFHNRAAQPTTTITTQAGVGQILGGVGGGLLGLGLGFPGFGKGIGSALSGLVGVGTNSSILSSPLVSSTSFTGPGGFPFNVNLPRVF